jgi:hypothetical protein
MLEYQYKRVDKFYKNATKYGAKAVQNSAYVFTHQILTDLFASAEKRQNYIKKLIIFLKNRKIVLDF